MAVAASVNGAIWLISSAVRACRPGPVSTAFSASPISASELIELREAGALQHQRPVVVGEALAPATARRDMFWSSRLNGSSERGRMRSTFHEWKNSCDTVSRMSGAVTADSSAGAGERGAVAMLHAVAARPRQLDAEERVGVVLVGGNSPKDVARFADDPLGVLREGVELPRRCPSWCSAMRNVGALPPPVGHGERPHREGAESVGLSIRYCSVGAVKTERVAPWEELRGHLPVVPGRLHERDATPGDRTSPRPHQRRGHVDVRMRRVDAEVGAVDAIAEDLDRCTRTVAAVLRRRPTRAGWDASTGSGLPLPSVTVTSNTFFANSCSRVTARGRAAYPQLQRPRRKVGERMSTSINRCSRSGNATGRRRRLGEGGDIEPEHNARASNATRTERPILAMLAHFCVASKGHDGKPRQNGGCASPHRH